MMACRGVFFAVSSAQKEQLLALDSDEKRLGYVQEEIEEPWDGSSRTRACYVFVDDSIAAVSRPRLLATRDQEHPGNSSIKGRKHCTIRLSELCEMTIGCLLRCFDPRRKVRNIKIVGNKCKLQDVFCLQAEQQRACLGNSKSI
jgi:hypothetical protein